MVRREMDQAVDAPVLAVESGSDDVEVSGKPAVISAVDGICAEVRELEQPGVLGGKKEGYFSQCVESPPPGSTSAKLLTQYLKILPVTRLCNGDYSPVFAWTASVVAPNEEVEPTDEAFKCKSVMVLVGT